ncbi:Hypothetical predicted protein [Paramuricea clavata]|uniref:Uncharacterized protein n=1 Tax=Paramuricea clavata TaxID=317549 RepID=A0A6S7J1E1_PARCT|nr:Hypothetical predicted protein [Paramuricea clavata]
MFSLIFYCGLISFVVSARSNNDTLHDGVKLNISTTLSTLPSTTIPVSKDCVLEMKESEISQIVELFNRNFVNVVDIHVSFSGTGDEKHLLSDFHVSLFNPIGREILYTLAREELGSFPWTLNAGVRNIKLHFKENQNECIKREENATDFALENTQNIIRSINLETNHEVCSSYKGTSSGEVKRTCCQITKSNSTKFNDGCSEPKSFLHRSSVLWDVISVVLFVFAWFYLLWLLFVFLSCTEFDLSYWKTMEEKYCVLKRLIYEACRDKQGVNNGCIPNRHPKREEKVLPVVSKELYDKIREELLPYDINLFYFGLKIFWSFAFSFGILQLINMLNEFNVTGVVQVVTTASLGIIPHIFNIVGLRTSEESKKAWEEKLKLNVKYMVEESVGEDSKRARTVLIMEEHDDGTTSEDSELVKVTSDSTTANDRTTDDTTTNDTTADDTTANDTTANDTTADDTTTNDTTTNDTTADDTTANDTTADDTTANDTTADDTTANDTTANDTRADDTTANDTAANDTTADDTTTNDTTADDTTVDDTTANDTTADDTTANDTTADDTTADD